MVVLLFIVYILILLMLFFPILGGIMSIFLAFFLRKKKALVSLIIGILNVGLFISLYIPDTANDLYRYFQTMTSIANLPNLANFFEFSKIDPTLQYQNNLLFNLFEFGIAKTGHFYLLPYLTIVICYFCVLYPIFDLKEKNKISSSFSFVLAIAMLSIYSTFYITTLVRWALACAVYILCTYCYFIKLNAKKRNIWILFIPLFIHLGSILAVGVAIYTALIKKVNKRSLLFPVPIFILIFALSLVANVTNVDNIVLRVVRMIQGYQDFARPEGFTNWISYILDLGTIIIFAIIAFKYMNKENFQNSIAKFEFNFRELFLLYLFMITSLQIWQRYGLIIGAFSLILYAMNYSKFKENRIYVNGIILLCLLIRIYFIWYMKFKGMCFEVSNSELWLSDISYYIQHLFSIYY